MSTCALVKSNEKLFCNEIHSNSSNRNIFGQLIGSYSHSNLAQKRPSAWTTETSSSQKVNNT
jgi:hypothetical protein